MYRALRSPISVQVEMTQRCNSSCLHCYNHWRTGEANGWLDSPSILRIVKELATNDIFDVTITGGEPLLRPRETLSMSQLLQDAGINFSMNSNLRLLTPRLASALREAGLRTILTSFVSNDRRRHAQITQSSTSFDQVVRGIEVAKEHGLAVAANMVLSRINIADLRETALFLRTLGVENFCATKISPPSDLRNVEYLLLSREEVRQSLVTLVELESELGINVDILECYPLCLIKDGKRFPKFFRRGCVAGVSACAVGSDGTVRPCSHASQGYGNILHEHLEVIWRRMDDWRDGRYIPSMCKTCHHLPSCTGGCRIDACVHGGMNSLDPCAHPEDQGQIVYPERRPVLNAIAYQLPPFNSRTESFGRVIYSQKACFPVNDAGFKIIDGLRSQTFLLDGFDDKTRDFLQHLVMLGFASPAPQ